MRKTFDCVKLQREVREKLNAQYPTSQESELLHELKIKFGNLRKHATLR
ncbi:MAG: hypothetical protein HY402_01870 [Elusimicrobia bacterium]|nr:hypothetical protein [Elusimicrobiota bacterium]